jgi:hypothetical protein
MWPRRVGGVPSAALPGCTRVGRAEDGGSVGDPVRWERRWRQSSGGSAAPTVATAADSALSSLLMCEAPSWSVTAKIGLERCSASRRLRGLPSCCSSLRPECMPPASSLDRANSLKSVLTLFDTSCGVLTPGGVKHVNLRTFTLLVVRVLAINLPGGRMVAGMYAMCAAEGAPRLDR